MFVLIIRLSAQPYPVDAFVRMHPPFSPFLEDWSSPANAPLHLQLRLQDAQEDQYPVKLRMSWLGQGIRISTKADFTQIPILLDYGVPLEMSGSDLAPYLDWNNLQIEGIDPNTLYQHGGRLPEGIYNFCVEVLDAQRPNEAPLSNQTCTLVQLELLPPPQILFPEQESQLPELPINFQWIPQHLGNFPIQYTFSLYEKRPGLSDLQILNSTAPQYTTNTLGNTYLLYDSDEPPLDPGMSYLVQIEVEDLLEQHHFRAEGRSQVHTFHYGEIMNSSCQLSSPALAVHVQDSQGFNAFWTQIATSHSYEIQLATDSSFMENRSNHHTHSVTDTFVNFSGLLSQHPYYLRIRATAGECFSDYSQIGPIRLSTRCHFQKELESTVYNCGLEDEQIDLSQSSTFQHLQEGDSIWAHQFPVVVSKVVGKGPFNGEAYGSLAYLKQAQVNFQLRNIEIDQQCRLISGQLVVTGGGIKLLDDNALALLNNLIQELEVLEDWLVVAEDILSSIDHIIAEVERYLPLNIINNLMEAQLAAQAAQQAYDAALEAGEPEEIQAAKAGLEEAITDLKVALNAYKSALLEFLTTWLEVAAQVFQDLLQGCFLDQLKTAYRGAEIALRELVNSDTEIALSSLPVFDGNYQEMSAEQELIIIEPSDTSEQEAFDVLSAEFYQKEMDYLLCQTLNKLETEIKSPETVAAFQQILVEINANSLAIIGEAIGLGLPTSEIVQQVKAVLYEDLQQLIKRSTYPSAIILSTQ